MGEVIDLNVARDAQINSAFVEFTAAKNRADQTLRILDMLAATRAWERFVIIAFPDPRERIGLL